METYPDSKNFNMNRIMRLLPYYGKSGFSHLLSAVRLCMEDPALLDNEQAFIEKIKIANQDTAAPSVIKNKIRSIINRAWQDWLCNANASPACPIPIPAFISRLILVLHTTGLEQWEMDDIIWKIYEAET